MPSVAEILAIRSLALEPITVPHPQLEARWVATSELPNPSQFLEGGEILLTTGLVERTADDWRLFVDRMLESSVVAVGFGVGLSHPAVPEALSEAARDRELNLFVVPRRVPFIAVSRAVADRLWAAEREVDRLALQHQRDLTTAALRGTEPLLDALAATVTGSAVLCSADGERLAGRGADELLDRARPLISQMAASRGRAASSELAPGSRLAVHPVGVGRRADAFLVVESAAPHRVAVTTALALLSLDRERARAERDADRRIRSGALSLALRSDTDAARLLLAGSPTPVALPESRARVLRARGSQNDREDALDRLERAAPPEVLVAMIGDSLVAVIGAGDADRVGLLGMLDRLEVGVGPVRDLAQLSGSDEAARLALAAATPVRPVVDWGELVDAGVDSLLEQKALDSFADELLAAVAARSDGDELTEALRAYLTHNGQTAPAASALGVHRNTLRNRLAAAEDALGRSLDDPQLRADLWVALKSLTRRRGSFPLSRAQR